MPRLLNICLVIGLVALAYVIYQVKYQARGLDAEISALHKRIGEERDAIAVLRAEWSLLNRPERIERLAKKYLKLAPAKPAQLITPDTVSDDDFGPVLAAPAAPEPDPAAKSTKPPARSNVSVASAPGADDATAWPAAEIERPLDAR